MNDLPKCEDVREGKMTKWTFRRYTRNGHPREVAVRSADHAIELLMEHTCNEYGVVIELTHADSGLITCIANSEFSTLKYSPKHRPDSPSHAGACTGLRIKPVSKDPFLFEYGGQASTMEHRYVLPIVKVIRAVKHIVEHREFPGGIRWSEPVIAMK